MVWYRLVSVRSVRRVLLVDVSRKGTGLLEPMFDRNRSFLSCGAGAAQNDKGRAYSACMYHFDTVLLLTYSYLSK